MFADKRKPKVPHSSEKRSHIGPRAQVTTKFIQKQNNLDIKVFFSFQYRKTVLCLINQKKQNALRSKFLEIEKKLLNLRHKLFFISSYHVSIENTNN